MNAFEVNELLTYDVLRIAVQLMWEAVPADYFDELLKSMEDSSQ